MKFSGFVIFALVISFLGHAVNMFNFPYYENDEGVYLSQAWSVIHLHTLAPYTYWYDHAPVGWLFIASILAPFKWLYLFGFSLNWGRVFMLGIHLLSSVFLLRIAKKITGSYVSGAIAVVVFSLSPLGIYFQRRLLLDNIMIFWVLLAYLILIYSGSKISRIAVSAVVLGIAALTKENAVFFAPGFLVTIWFITDRHNRLISLLVWPAVLGLVISSYVLFAVQKGELFPSGTALGGSSPHVSLIGSLDYQLNRAGGASFIQNYRGWVNEDPWIIYAGILANFIFLIYSFFSSRRYLGLALFGPLFWWFLSRGGLTIEFYIIPMIPLLAVYIGLVLYFIPRRFPVLSWPVLIWVTIFFGYVAVKSGSAGRGSTHAYSIFTSRQTQAQLQAMDWIHKFVPTDSFIVVDNYSWLDLHDPANPSGLVYPNAHWYWKIDQDPAIKIGILNSDPSRIDYLAETPQMESDLQQFSSPTTAAAIAHARVLQRFNADGWSVQIWGTIYPRQILTRSWNYYKNRFITNEGRVIDPGQNNHTTSEGQSYALLRAVWIDDRVTFDKVLNWTIPNLQKPDGTFIWLYSKGESSSASDADVDIATALLLANSRWQNDNYLTQAKGVISGIWNAEMKNGYLLPGNWALSKSYILLNPSYLSPASFRLFAAADPEHDWNSAVNASYAALNSCTHESLGLASSALLPPNWCALDDSGNAVKPTESGTDSTEYTYDAVRVMWRVALDYFWNADPRARDYLNMSSAFFQNKWGSGQPILVGYTHDGQEWEKYESSLGYSAVLANFMFSDPASAEQVYKTKIEAKFYEDFSGNYGKSYWDDPENYYTQNWAWFATALYTGFLKNKF